MIVLGRSLAVARAAQIALASVSAALPYLAMRSVGSRRRAAVAAFLFAVVSPWSIWLGAAAVPESFTASLTAAAAIRLGARDREPSNLDGLLACALLASALSRYEVWPVAATIAIALVVRALVRREPRRSRGRDLALAAVVAIGPILWMAWNVHAHGSAFHFYDRVSSFKRALGEGTTDTRAALSFYPWLLATRRPEIVVATLAGLTTLASPTLRRRWAVPLLCAAMQIGFLAYGNVRDGAPAHHPERALLAVTFLLAAFAADAGDEALSLAWSRGALGRLGAGLALGSLLVLWAAFSTRPEMPGRAAYEDRRPQLARGRELHQRVMAMPGKGTFMTIEPCAFEHFALLAAFEAPERAEIRPRSGAPLDATCPRITAASSAR